MLIKAKNGYCINCDNRHGCKTKTPPCLDRMEKDAVRNKTGKQYLIDCAAIGLCEECPFFRTCWNMEEYERKKVVDNENRSV